MQLEMIHDPATGLFLPLQSATQDGQAGSGVPMMALAGYNGATFDRLTSTNKILNTNPRTLAAGIGGDSVNANVLKGVLYNGAVSLNATVTIGPLDVSLYRSLVIDWNISVFTGTGSPSVALTISSVDEQGNLHTVNATALSFAATGSAIIYMGTDAGTLTDTGTTRRYPDLFRRKVQFVFTETTMTALTSTLTVVGS